MRWHQRQFNRPPRQLRNPRVHFDNLALVPGSLLPYKAQWQELANRLPAGQVLIILPTGTGSRQTLDATAKLLRAKGLEVTTLCTQEFTPERK